MSLSQPYDEELAQEWSINKLESLGVTHTLVSSMDVDGSGAISLEEFREQVVNPRSTRSFYNLGLDIRNVELFFESLVAMSQGLT